MLLYASTCRLKYVCQTGDKRRTVNQVMSINAPLIHAAVCTFDPQDHGCLLIGSRVLVVGMNNVGIFNAL